MSGDAGQRFYRPDCFSVKQQTSELMGSWDPGGTGATEAMDHRNLESSMDSRDFTSKDPCAVPIGLCHAVKGGATMSESMDLLSPDVRILCTNSGCDYGGPVHRSCLSRWSSCCELRCRMLASIPGSSTGRSVPQLPGFLTDATNAMLDGLLTLYRCPQCAQCTLCRMVLNPIGTFAFPFLF
ncbi:hypothetical protein FGIG_00503 [Fasciola gigantica]|uniref:Uncharacterized protein n=1 Tax=Fasciola gigantica TaxID=46835 RepID=A0A504YXH6_FASGI|nr:hypothetical protein FGIG_00503 [Fasciola gigantica]